MRRVAPFAHILILIAFIFNCLGPIPSAQADLLVLPSLPKIEYPQNLAAVKGLSIHPDNPLQFDLIVEPNSKNLDQTGLRDQSMKMIKYFLASITTPEKDMWVNLSPYEKNRIIPDTFGQTLMGRDLLANDYILKQITASLIHPDTQIGKEFWTKIYAEAQAKFGTTNVPINTFNKVWIMPDKATVWEHKNSVFVIERHLRVMLEQDYLSMNKHMNAGVAEGGASPSRAGMSTMGKPEGQDPSNNGLGSQIVRDIVIPALEREVNEGQSFAQLRQIYNAMILATWYKKKIKDSLLGNVYMDKNKVQGVNINDPQAKEKIYKQYLQTFKKGVFNFIKEEPDPTTGEMVPRKYFSGGMVALSPAMLTTIESDYQQLPSRAQAALPTSAAMRVTFKTAFANPAMQADSAMMASALTEEEIQIFEEQLPAWDWRNGSQAPWNEDTHDSGQPLPVDDNEKNLFKNQIAVRKEFLGCIKSILLERVDVDGFEANLKRMFELLILGENGENFYLTGDLSSRHLSSEDELISLVRNSIERLRNDSFWHKKIVFIFDAIKEIISLKSKNVSLQDVINRIGIFYFHYIKENLFPLGGNNSVGMNMVNGLLRLYGLTGIAHSYLDFNSRALVKQKSEKEFLEMFLNIVKKAGNNEFMLDNQSVDHLTPAMQADAAMKGKEETVKQILLHPDHRPEPLDMMKLIQEQHLSEDDIHKTAQSAGFLPLTLSKTLTEVDSLVPYVIQVVDSLYERYGRDPNHTILFAGRDAENLYDAYMVRAKLKGWTVKAKLFPGSSIFWQAEIKPTKKFFEYFGLTPTAFEKDEYFVIFDAGFWGSIGEFVVSRMEQIYPEFISLIKSHVISKLVCSSLPNRQLMPEFSKPQQSKDILFPRVKAIGFMPSSINDWVATALQILPRFHGSYIGFDLTERGKGIFQEHERYSKEEEIEKVDSMNADIVNPYAALLVQHRLLSLLIENGSTEFELSKPTPAMKAEDLLTKQNMTSPFRFPMLLQRLLSFARTKANHEEPLNVMIFGPGSDNGNSFQTFEVASVLSKGFPGAVHMTVLDANPDVLEDVMKLRRYQAYHDERNSVNLGELKSRYFEIIQILAERLKGVTAGKLIERFSENKAEARSMDIDLEKLRNVQIKTSLGTNEDFGSNRDVIIATLSFMYKLVSIKRLEDRRHLFVKLIRSLKNNGEGKLFIHQGELISLDLSRGAHQNLEDLKKILLDEGITIQIETLEGDILEITNTTPAMKASSGKQINIDEELSTKDLEYLDSLGVTRKMVENSFENPNRTAKQSLGFGYENQHFEKTRIDQKKFLVEDLLKMMEKKRDKKKIVIYQIGLGKITPTLESGEIIASVNEAFQRSGMAAEEAKDWKIHFVALDYDSEIISLFNRNIVSTENAAGALIRRSPVEWEVQGMVMDTLNKKGMELAWEKADYIIHRNTTYASQLASTVMSPEPTIGEMPRSVKSDSHVLGNMLNIFVSIRNVISLLAQPGTRYITEKATRNEQKAVLHIPGAKVITANTYSQQDIPFVEDSVDNLGTGFFEIEDPQGMESLGLQGFINLHKNPAMQTKDDSSFDEKEYTTDDFKNEGYSFETQYRLEDKEVSKEALTKVNTKVTLYTFIKRNGFAVTYATVTLYVYPKQKVVIVNSFYPEFPKERRGRGRALLKQILAQNNLGGFRIFIEEGEDPFLKSLDHPQMKDFGFKKASRFGAIKNELDLEGLSGLDRSGLETHINSSNLEGLVPAKFSFAMRADSNDKFLNFIGFKDGDQVTDVGSILWNLADKIVERKGTYHGFQGRKGEPLSAFELSENVNIHYSSWFIPGGKSRILPDHSQDFVLMMTGVLSDLDAESDPMAVLQEAVRVLKPGGRIVFGSYVLQGALGEYEDAYQTIERFIAEHAPKGVVFKKINDQTKTWFETRETFGIYEVNVSPAMQADAAEDFIKKGLTKEDLEYLESLGSTEGLIGDFFAKPPRTVQQSFGLDDGISNPDIIKIDQQRFLVDDLLRVIEMKKQDKNLVIYQIGLGKEDPIKESSQILSAIEEAFQRSGIPSTQIRDWNVKFIGLDYDRKVIESFEKMMASYPLRASVSWEIKAKTLDTLSEKDMNLPWGKADYIFHRNTTYANLNASRAGEQNLGNAPLYVPKSIGAFRHMLDIYISLRNVINYLSRQGTRYITEAAEKNLQDRVLRIPGAKIISFNTYPQMQTYPQNSVDNLGTGFYEIEDPQGMVKFGLRSFMELQKNPAMQASSTMKAQNESSPAMHTAADNSAESTVLRFNSREDFWNHYRDMKEDINVELPVIIYSLKYLIGIINRRDLGRGPIIVWQNLRLGEMYPFLSNTIFDSFKKALGIEEMENPQEDLIEWQKNPESIPKRFKKAKMIIIKIKKGSTPSVGQAKLINDVSVENNIDALAMQMRSDVIMIDSSRDELSTAQKDVRKMYQNSKWTFFNPSIDKRPGHLSLFDSFEEYFLRPSHVGDSVRVSIGGAPEQFLSEIARQELAIRIWEEIKKDSDPLFDSLRSLAMQASSAMKAPGGIDMNSNNLQLSIKRDGEGIPLPASLQDWSSIHINGLEPVIIKMERVNLAELIGT